MSGFLNHCNDAEGTLDSGDLLQIRTRPSGKGGTWASPSTHPTYETNKQAWLSDPSIPLLHSHSSSNIPLCTTLKVLRPFVRLRKTGFGNILSCVHRHYTFFCFVYAKLPGRKMLCVVSLSSRRILAKTQNLMECCKQILLSNRYLTDFYR